MSFADTLGKNTREKNQGREMGPLMGAISTYIEACRGLHSLQRSFFQFSQLVDYEPHVKQKLEKVC